MCYLTASFGVMTITNAAQSMANKPFAIDDQIMIAIVLLGFISAGLSWFWFIGIQCTLDISRDYNSEGSLVMLHRYFATYITYLISTLSGVVTKCVNRKSDSVQ